MKISRNKTGKWMVDFTLHGRRIRRVIGDSKRQAEAAAAAIKADILRNKYNFPKQRKYVLFEEFADQYFDQHSQKKKSYETDAFHIARLKSWFRGKTLSSITHEFIEKYQMKRVKEVSNATVNREIACLKHMFTKAQDWGLLDKSPARKIKMFQEKPKERRILNDEEIERLMITVENSESKFLHPFVVIALNTGMRPSEILSLKWNDIKSESGYILIRDSKTGRSRKVPMNDRLFELFKKTERENEYIFFNSETKAPIKSMRLSFNRACSKIGIKDASPYCLRHTVATKMVNELGIDIVTAGKILGHSKVEMTLRYCHPSRETMYKAIRKIGEHYNYSSNINDSCSSDIFYNFPKNEFLLN
ncbi:MAG: site-specific integrase [Candidatus Aminicenantes bacterium]|nr:site-specific integrase [Candidatus Aminicenantes bacterium]